MKSSYPSERRASPMPTPNPNFSTILDLKTLSIEDTDPQYADANQSQPSSSDQSGDWTTFDSTIISMGANNAEKIANTNLFSSGGSSQSSSSNSRASSINDPPTDLVTIPAAYAETDSSTVSRRKPRMRSPPPPPPPDDFDHLMGDDDDEEVPLYIPAPQQMKKRNSSSRFGNGSTARKLGFSGNSGLFKKNSSLRRTLFDDRYSYPILRSENENAVLKARRQEQIRAYKARSLNEIRPKRRPMRGDRNSRRANLIWNRTTKTNDDTRSIPQTQGITQTSPSPPEDDNNDDDNDDNTNGAGDEDSTSDRQTRRVHFAV